MLLPTQAVVETEGSKKIDEEVREILHREEPGWYEAMRPEVIAALEPQRIRRWRLEKMKVLGENVVFVRKLQFGADSYSSLGFRREWYTPSADLTGS